MQWNLTKNSASFATGIFRKKPLQVLVQVTNRCNMKCSFCDFWPNGVQPKHELTLSDYESIANQLSELGTCLISIEGGEPLLRPDIVEIVRAFGKNHLPVLYTNGWFMTPELASDLFAAGLAQVGVSIDFATEEKHDKKRKLKGAFSRAWQAIEHLKAAANNSEKQVHVMSVFMKDNQDEIEQLLRMSQANKVGHCMTLISLNGFRRAQGDNALPDAPVSERLLSLWKRNSHFRVFRSYLQGMDAYIRNEKLPTCNAGQQSFNIDHVGNVSPCIEKIDHTVGNIKTDSLESLVAKMQNLEMVAQCQDCFSLCRGFHQALGDRSSLQNLLDLSNRMRTV